MSRWAAAIAFVCWASSAQATTTYYVASNASGASNTLCNGLAATDQGGGTCPFLDLTNATVKALLQNVSDTTVTFCGNGVVYDVGASAFIMQGTGASFNQAVSITNCPGDTVYLDGGYLSRETVRLTGSYGRISSTSPGGLVIRRAHDYNIECRGATHFEILNVTITDNSASDLLKLDGGCADGTISGNDLSLWVSQCIDVTGTLRVTFSRNYCHRPQVAGQPCIGVKFESDDVTVFQNIFEGCAVGVAMGGVSSTHAGSYEALRLIVDDNQFVNLTSFTADVYSCVTCTFRNNHVWGGVAGIRLGGIGAQGQSGCNAGAGNCDATSSFTASSNIFRALKASPNNSFWLVNSTELTGVSITGMQYCTLPGDTTDRYAIDSVIKTRAQWLSGVGTDSDGVVIAAPDLRCSGRMTRVRAKRR